MKKTFVCDESMIITIPIGSLRDAQEGQLMPEKFQCVYRDSYKVFVIKGKPKPLGAAQAIAGVFILSLGLIINNSHTIILIYTVPSVLFVISGILSYAAGHSPNMHVTKLSLSLNIISFFWSVAAVTMCALLIDHPYYHPYATYHDWNNGPYYYPNPKVYHGINGLIISLLVVEKLIALFLIYWLSKAVCRQDFNTLPTILLKQGD